MKNGLWNVRPTVILLAAVATLFLGITFFLDDSKIVFAVELVAWAVAMVFAVWYILHRQHIINRLMRQLMRQLNVADKKALAALPLAVAAVSSKGEIVWFNKAFSQTMEGHDHLLGQSVESILSDMSFEEMRNNHRFDLKLNGRCFTVTVDAFSYKDELTYLLYYWDDTDLKNIAEEYALSRPVVLSVVIDNMEELFQSTRDSDRARISGQVEKLLEDWIGTTSGIIRKYDAYRFFVVVEQRDLQKMSEDRFSILNAVRTVEHNGVSGLTLSIGVGSAETLHQSELQAQQAMEMALGRGGDQVAVKTETGYDFYGGRSQGVERRTKVRTRVMAKTIRELLDDSDNVIVMGHRFSDLDCLGSGTALAHTLRSKGKPAVVAVNRKTTLAPELLAAYDEAGQKDLFVDEDKAHQLLTDRSLLIITDTHASNLVEYPSLYDEAKNVVVIDHHRKTVNFIDKATIFFHEPSASSASEMVAELLPYLTDNAPIDKLDAEALLAGIILDTKGFIMKAGTRTFEAAAYLRSSGADTISVKKLSSGSMELYHVKSDIIASAQPFRNTIIATCNVQGSSLVRVAAAQAADELLSVKGVDASFALFVDGDRVNISARSYGRFNVQLIMEALGGGGHMTMAAAQIVGADIPSAIERLKTEIDRQLAENREV